MIELASPVVTPIATTAANGTIAKLPLEKKARLAPGSSVLWEASSGSNPIGIEFVVAAEPAFQHLQLDGAPSHFQIAYNPHIQCRSGNSDKQLIEESVKML